jgi:hypothetical protein
MEAALEVASCLRRQGADFVAWPSCVLCESDRVRIAFSLSRFEQGKDDFIENIDDVCIHYDGGRVAANDSLIAEISARGLRKTTEETGLDRKTIRGILNGKKVKVSTLVKVVMELRHPDA